MKQTRSSVWVDWWEQLTHSRFGFLELRSTLVIDNLHERRYRLHPRYVHISNVNTYQNYSRTDRRNIIIFLGDVKRQNSTDPSHIIICYTDLGIVQSGNAYEHSHYVMTYYNFLRTVSKWRILWSFQFYLLSVVFVKKRLRMLKEGKSN